MPPDTDTNSDAKHTGFNFARFTAQLSMGWILLFWLLVMAALYGGLDYYMSARQSVIVSNGDVVIRKDTDGHYRARGKVNGQEVLFLVDTGATTVSVSDATAKAAGLPEGTAMEFDTAGGMRQGRMVDGVTIELGPLSVSQLHVGTGLQTSDSHEALLGQNFLNKFKLSIEDDKLTLSPRH
jgi:aspartyl protease family protein